MDDVFRILFAVVFFLVLFVFPFFAARFVIRRLGGGPDQVGRYVLMCPRCSSAAVERLEGNGITPFPGYVCRGCGVHMRPPGTGAFYALVLVICAGLMALFTVPLWLGGGGTARVFPFMLLVGGFAVYQLLRPTPRRGPTELDESSESET